MKVIISIFFKKNKILPRNCQQTRFIERINSNSTPQQTFVRVYNVQYSTCVGEV